MMQCLECGAEMQLVETIRDDSMPAPGYEDRTFECSSCHQVERRRIFRGQVASAPTALVPDISASVGSSSTASRSSVAVAAVASTIEAVPPQAASSAPWAIEPGAARPIASTAVPSGNAGALNEDQALLRRAIAMVRGPVGTSQAIKGITDGLKSPGATPAATTRARKSGRVVQLRHDTSCDAAFAARDVRTGMVVLRHRDRMRLREMCDRLGWQVAEDDAAASTE